MIGFRIAALCPKTPHCEMSGSGPACLLTSTRPLRGRGTLVTIFPFSDRYEKRQTRDHVDGSSGNPYRAPRFRNSASTNLRRFSRADRPGYEYWDHHSDVVCSHHIACNLYYAAAASERQIPSLSPCLISPPETEIEVNVDIMRLSGCAVRHLRHVLLDAHRAYFRITALIRSILMNPG